MTPGMKRRNGTDSPTVHQQTIDEARPSTRQQRLAAASFSLQFSPLSAHGHYLQLDPEITFFNTVTHYP
jgi:hypothetical protein